MCTAFCQLQKINYTRMHPDQVRDIMVQARMHLNFVCSHYEEQIKGGRFFIHEHKLMAPYGGFDHNAQAIKIVTTLERHYAEFDGLNLTWDTLEGIAKHNGPVTGDVPHALADYNARHDLELHTHASAEALAASTRRGAAAVQRMHQCVRPRRR